MDGTGAAEDFQYVQHVFNIMEWGEEFMNKNPSKVSAKEFKPFTDAFRATIARGEYHLHKTLEM